MVPYQGIFVSEITLKDIEDLYAVRERLELYAIELCISRIPEEALQSCYEEIQAQNLQGMEKSILAGEEIHAMVLQYADNQLLKRMMEGLYDHMHRVRVLSTTKDRDVQCTRDEHIEILKALQSRDTLSACTAMVHHIQGSKKRALAVLLQDNEKMYFKL